MEGLLEIILELLLELLLQLACETLVLAAIQKRWTKFWTRKTSSPFLALPIYVGFGVLTGWLSILIIPRSFIRSSSLHGISLIITPSLAGAAMWGIGRLRRRPVGAKARLDTFGYGFAFAFGMAIIRFLFTK
jgi:hypothetical protein